MASRALGFGTIRARITATAAIAVAVVLTVVAIALVMLVRWELFSNLDDSLEQRADTYQTALTGTGPGDLSLLFNTNDEDRAAQLVAADGTVIASTANLVGQAPPADRPATRSTESIETRTVDGLEDDAYRVLERPIVTADATVVLFVAQNIDDLNDTIRVLTIGLAFLVPLVVGILAALVWRLVGRTLRPVELIRAEVADISGTDLQRRVPVPDQADEIARLASTMNQMLDRIDQAGRRQRQFVADASHELRTPLTRIRTEVEVDLEQPERADPSTTNATVRREAIALQQLLDDLLFLARSDEHQRSRSHRPTDLDDIVLREVRNLRETTPITIDTSSVSAAHLDADAGELGRVVGNLLSNAVRHAADRVTVALGEDTDSVVLVVTDDGPGVAPEARDRIFERFGRADDARARSRGGAGLGLAIVRDIVARHGGEIRYDDTWDEGARFVVRLPRTREEPEPADDRPTT